MNNSQNSCIVNQLTNLTNLTDTEIELLATLEKDPREYPKDCRLADVGSEADRFFTLQSGWACATRTLADGQRQVLDIFLPGQIMGLREMSFHHNLSEFRSITAIVACPFPREHLSEIFDKSPKLTDLFFMILAREQSMLIERVINIGRRNAAERLAHFIVEMKVRLNQTSEEFELPLNQTIIGDALSLSSVHVSRTFRTLKEKNLITKTDNVIQVKDLDALIDFAGFDRSYLDSHCHWARDLNLSAAAR